MPAVPPEALEAGVRYKVFRKNTPDPSKHYFIGTYVERIGGLGFLFFEDVRWFDGTYSYAISIHPSQATFFREEEDLAGAGPAGAGAPPVGTGAGAGPAGAGIPGTTTGGKRRRSTRRRRATRRANRK